MLSLLGELARGGAEALERGDLQDLGVRFDAAHGVLSAVGVSCPELEDAVAILRRAGALGCVLSGAGPSLLALVSGDGHAVARAMEAALRVAGVEGRAQTYTVDTSGATVLRVHG